MRAAEAPPRVPDEPAYLNPLEIDDWDSRLAPIPGATFFHSAAWARVLNSTYGYRPLYFSAGPANSTVSLLPFMEIDSWLTGRRGVSLPFTDECEPLGPDAGSIARLFQNAQAHGHRRRWRYLECRGGLAALGDVPVSTSYFNHRLALQADEAALFAQCSSAVRRAVRKASQANVTVEFSQDPAAVRTFYDLFCLTRQRHGAPPQPFAFFANIQRHVLAQNLGWVVLARNANRPVAGAMFFHFGRSVIYKFGASDESLQELRANNLVMWEAIRWYSRRNFTTLDFGRTSLQNEGLRRFKLGWGAQERRIDYLRYDLRKRRFARVRDQSSGILCKILQKSPIFLSRLIGVLLYKHIGMLLLLLDWNHRRNFA